MENIDTTEKTSHFIPGNWFELRTYNRKKLAPYTLEQLEAVIYDQVLNHSDQLNFIQANYGSIYKDKQIQLELNLKPSDLELFNNYLETEKFHPILAFHGTAESNVKSIQEGGYLVPGQGKVKRAHGSMYGLGVYTSPFLAKAFSYTNMRFARANEPKPKSFILVNLVFLGRAKLLAPSEGTQIRFGNKEELDTKILYGLDQIVSKDPKRIIPIGLLTLE